MTTRNAELSVVFVAAVVPSPSPSSLFVMGSAGFGGFSAKAMEGNK